MDIQDLGAIGEFLSSIVVMVTLIALTFQLREGKRQAQEANIFNYNQLAIQTLGSEMLELAGKVNLRLLGEEDSALTPYAERWGISYGEANALVATIGRVFINLEYLMSLSLPKEQKSLLLRNQIQNLSRPLYRDCFQMMVHVDAVSNTLYQDIEEITGCKFDE